MSSKKAFLVQILKFFYNKNDTLYRKMSLFDGIQFTVFSAVAKVNY